MSDTQIPEWDLGDRLAKARRWAGLEQEDLAEDFGLTRQAISKYERGVSVPKLVVIKQWALRTKAPLEWLLDQPAAVTDPEPPKPKGRRPRGREQKAPLRSRCFADLALELAG